jgi:hypothetical protein
MFSGGLFTIGGFSDAEERHCLYFYRNCFARINETSLGIGTLN